MKKITVAALVATFVSIVIFLSINKHPSLETQTEVNNKLPFPQALDKETEQAIKKEALSDIEQLEKDIAEEVMAMETLIAQGFTDMPDEYKEKPGEREKLENLIAHVEQVTGERVEVDLANFVLDPIEHKEQYELEKKFDALEQEMQGIIDKL